MIKGSLVYLVLMILLILLRSIHCFFDKIKEKYRNYIHSTAVRK